VSEALSRFTKITRVLRLLAWMTFFFMFASLFQFLKAAVAGGEDTGASRVDHLTELKIDGPILSADTYLASLKRIDEDSHCKGVLVRIESPGGAVGASQEIFQALNALRAKGLSVVVSQANIAASGGYYISLAGERIFTNPGTLTGSIGVIFQFPEAEKLMGKIGVGLQTVKSGALKDVGNIARTATPAEIGYLQTVIDDVYAQFFADILSRRPISADSLKKVADGRILTGKQAVAWQLADSLGGYTDAKGYLEAKTGVDPETPMSQEPPALKWYDEWMEGATQSRYKGLAEIAERLVPDTRSGLFFLTPSF
jgi:protease IV